MVKGFGEEKTYLSYRPSFINLSAREAGLP
jgi:hypothetical protein